MIKEIVVLRLGLEPRLDVYKTSSLTISRPQGLMYKTERIPEQSKRDSNSLKSQ